MSRFDNGWIKFYRRAFFEDIGRNQTCLALWAWFLCMANWKETKIIWEGKQRVLPPGTVVFGIRELSEQWGCSKSLIAKWTKYLHDTGRIVFESCPRGSIATICNWMIYQSDENQTQTQRGHNADTTGTQRGHNEPLIEEGKKEEGKKGRSRPKKPQTLCGAIPELSGDPLLEEKLSTVSQELQHVWLATYRDAFWIKKKMRKAIGWAVAKKKKHKNFGLFITNWLSGSDDQPEAIPPLSPPVPEENEEQLELQRLASVARKREMANAAR